jgi:multidrug efflux pump
MRQVVQFAGSASVAIGVVVSIALLAGSRGILGLFLHDPAAITRGIAWFRIAMLAQATYGGIYLPSSLFQAVGKATPALLLSVGQGVLLTPAVIIANGWFCVSGVATALPISEAATAALGLVLYLGMTRRIYGSAPSQPPTRESERACSYPAACTGLAQVGRIGEVVRGPEHAALV